MNFRNLAIVCALLCFSLAAVWLLAPDLLLNMWGIDFSASVGLVGRRGAALYAGIGVMLFCARNAEHSLAPSRGALSTERRQAMQTLLRPPSLA